MRTRAVLLLATGVLAMSVLAGCGDDGDDEALDPVPSGSSETSTGSPSPSPSPSESESSEAPPEESATPSATPDPLPGCSEVWVSGQKLPAKYKGCESGSGPVKAKKYPCSFGSSIVTFDDRFYAQLGRPINEVDSLKSSTAFQSALKACQA